MENKYVHNISWEVIRLTERVIDAAHKPHKVDRWRKLKKYQARSVFGNKGRKPDVLGKKD
jgi:hypothetical protein